MKKILLIVLGVIILIALVTLGVFNRTRNSTENQNITNQPIDSRTVEVSGNAVPVILDANGNQGTENSQASVGRPEVVVSNFLANAQPIEGLVPTQKFVDNPKYQIFYYPEEQAFHISIIDGPLVQVQKEAEREFMRQMGVSVEQLCSLAVTVNTPSFVSVEYSGKNLGLSFFPGAISAQE